MKQFKRAPSKDSKPAPVKSFMVLLIGEVPEGMSGDQVQHMMMMGGVSHSLAVGPMIRRAICKMATGTPEELELAIDKGLKGEGPGSSIITLH